MGINIVKMCMIVLFLKTEANARNFASSSDFKMLLKTEEEVIKSLKNYVKEEKKRLQFLEKYVARSKLEYEIAIKDIPHYLGNPINAYTIIKRLGPDLEYAERILRNKTMLKPPKAVLPTKEDIENTIIGVLSLLTMYDLEVSQMANGILNVNQSQDVHKDVSPMTASDCYFIGMAVYTDGQYSMAVPWLEEAYNKLEGVHCDICPVDIINVIDHIAKCYHELGDMEKFIEWTERRIFLRPKDHDSMVRAKYIDVLRHRENVIEKNTKEKKATVERNRQYTGYFTDMCQGRKRNNTTSNIMNLSCYYAHGPHPVLILAPMKAELLHHDPDITMYYDVISDEEIKELQNISTPLLWENTRSDRADYRNAEAVSLDDRAFSVVARVSRRSLALSGLSSEDCENLKVINYGIGGFYRNHWDTRMTKRHESDWDRHGSILIYLTEVEQGGATIFPLLDLTIFPKKGAAVFWMNLFPSGAVDVSTMHAACPVFRGAKWIAVKWPHHFNNNWCSVWIRNNKTVTMEMYKKIFKQREKKYRSVMGNHNKEWLEHIQFFGRTRN